MENSIERCTGNWLIENDSEVWTYRYFYKEDFAGRLFEVDHIEKKVNLYSALSMITIYQNFGLARTEFIKSISYEEFQKDFGNKVFLNPLYYELNYKYIL